jgi:membrane-bound ClpP family serine protease
MPAAQRTAALAPALIAGLLIVLLLPHGLGNFFAQVVAPAQEAVESDPTTSLLVAVSLLALALTLIAIEFVVVSGGLLGIAAVASAITAVVYAFSAGPLAGWVFVIFTPVLCGLVIKAGLGWMARSRMVVHAEIAADAGYHHVLSGTGIGPGSQGVLVTDADPSGRARFTAPTGPHELDVQLRGGASAKAGTTVTVKAIDGPVVFCDIHVTPSPILDPKGTP